MSRFALQEVVQDLLDPQKRRVLDLMRQRSRLVGDSLRSFVPLPTARQFLQCEKRFAICFGGNRSGKTETNMAGVAMVARNLHPYLPCKQLNKLWVIGESYDIVGQVLWEEKLKRYLPPFEIERLIWYNKQRGIPLRIYMKNGTLIEFKSYELGRQKVQAASVGLIACDEQMPDDFWDELVMRVADQGGYIRLSCTPIKYQEWLEKLANHPPKDYGIFYASLNENRISRGGYVSDAVIDAMIEQWPKSIQVTRIEGRFAAFEGVVFDEWNPMIHIVEARELPRHWDWFIGLDFGYNNPFAALLVCRDPDGRWWCVDEWYKSHTLLADHARALKRWTDHYPIQKIFADHDAQDRAELAHYGIPTYAAKKRLIPGIETVKSALKVKGNGQAGFFVMRDRCPNLVREMASYRWAEKKAGKNAPEEVVKLDDHAVDTVRYVLHSSSSKFTLAVGSHA